MTNEVSLDLENLRHFFESGQRYATALEAICETVAAARSVTVNAIGTDGIPPAEAAMNGLALSDPMAELIAETQINNGFVQTIHDALQSGSLTAHGVTVTGNLSIDQALDLTGLGNVGHDASLEQDQTLAALFNPRDPGEVRAGLTDAQQTKLDAYADLLANPGGLAVPVRVADIEDPDVRLLVAELIIEQAVADSRDPNRPVNLPHGHEPWMAVNTLVADVAGTDLQPFVAARLFQEGLDLEAELGHVAASSNTGPTDRHGRARQNQQETATVFVTLGLASMNEEQLSTVVGGLEGNRSQAQLIIDALDLDDDETEKLWQHAAGIAPIRLGDRQNALADLLAAAVDDDGVVRAGGYDLFDASIDTLQISGWRPGLPAEDDADTSGNNLRGALIAVAGAPNFGLSSEEYAAALEADRLLAALPEQPTDQQWLELEDTLAALGDGATIDFILTAMTADLSAAEALRISRSAMERPLGPYQYQVDYSPTDNRVDLLRLLLGTDQMGNPPSLEAAEAGGLPDGAGRSLISELRILQAIQMERWNSNKTTEADPPLTVHQLELIANFEANLGEIDRLSGALWTERLGGTTPTLGGHPPQQPTQYETLEAIAAGELTANPELVALANQLTAPSAGDVWSILLAAPDNTKFLQPDGTFGGYNSDLDQRLLRLPGYNVDSDNFTSLSVQLLLHDELAPTAPLLDRNSDGLITENDRENWLAERGQDIPPILRDRIRFGAGFGLGHDDWGWDELAEGLGLLGLTAAVVVSVVYSGGAAAPLWVKGGLVTLAGAEFIAASQAGDRVGAGLALFGGAADGVAFVRLLGRGAKVPPGAILELADNPKVWDEVSEVDRIRAYDRIVAETEQSDLPALRELADRADELSPKEYVAAYQEIAVANPEEFLAQIDDPIRRAIARRELGLIADPDLTIHHEPRWVSGRPAVAVEQIDDLLSPEALAEARSWSLTDEQIAEAIGAGAHTPHHFDHIGRGLHTGELKSYELKSLEPDYVGEQYGKSIAFDSAEVTYLSEVERQMLRVEIRNGKLYDASGHPVDTAASASLHNGDGKAVFVMGPDGHLYLSDYHGYQKFHHSSILGGEPVAGAGEVVVEDGVIVRLNRRSGHYQPSELHTAQVLRELEVAGVDIADIAVGSWH